jgi:hypothetical protein
MLGDLYVVPKAGTSSAPSLTGPAERIGFVLGAMALTVLTFVLALTVGGALGDAAIAGGRANFLLGFLVVLGAPATWGWWNAKRRRFSGPH